MPGSLNRDDQAVVDLLRASVRRSGLSQASFARAMGTSASRMSTYAAGTTRPSGRFCMRAVRLSTALGEAECRGLMSAPATAAAMRRHLRVGESAWVWRMLLQGRDHLSLMLSSDEAAALDSWEAEPATVGAAQWDALLAAVAARQFEQAGREGPGWTRVPALEPSWVPQHPFLSADRVVAQTPDWLGRRGIYVPARDLVTA